MWDIKNTPVVEAVNFSTLLAWEQKWVEAAALPLCVWLPTNNQLENRMLDYMGLFEPSKISLTFFANSQQKQIVKQENTTISLKSLG